MTIQYQLSYLLAESCSAQLFASIECRAYEGDNERGLANAAESVAGFECGVTHTVKGFAASW